LPMSDTPCTENLAMDPPPDEFRNWLALPREVTASILMRLDAFEILTSAQMVCSPWHKLCKDPSMWRAVHMRNSLAPYFILKIFLKNKFVELFGLMCFILKMYLVR
jgi:hypothetical protein